MSDKTPQRSGCKWALDDPEFDVWVTECGNAHTFDNGGPEENEYKYCCYCGGGLEVVANTAKEEKPNAD